MAAGLLHRHGRMHGTNGHLAVTGKDEAPPGTPSRTTGQASSNLATRAGADIPAPSLAMLPDVPACLAVVDRSAQLRAANPAWCAWLGVPLVQVPGLHLSDFVQPIAHSQLAILLHPDPGRSSSHQAELRMLDRNGRELVAAVTADLSNPATATLSFFDLTAVRAAQQDLVHRERRYRNLVDDQTDLVSLATLDGVLTFANHSYARAFGVSASEMIGRNLYEFIAEEDRAQVQRYLRRVLETGKVVTSQNRMINGDGRAAWYQWVNRVLPDTEGRMTILHSVGRDISERVLAERAMDVLNQEQKAILDSELIGIAKVRNRRFVWVSQGLSRMLGYQGQELLGASTVVLFKDQEWHDRLGAEAYPLLRSGRRFHREFPARRADGSEIWLDCSSVMFGQDNDELLCVYADVTARKQAETALRASLALEERQRSELVSLRDVADGENELARFLLQKLSRVEHLDRQGVAFHWMAAEVFSGDLIAVERSSTGDLYGMLADATGHGLAAAINLIPLSAAFYAMAAKGFNLVTISAQLNRVVKEYSLPDRFVAVTLARFLVRDHHLEILNAGNPAALLLDRDGRSVRDFASGSVPFGVLPPAQFRARIEQFALNGDEQLVLYSDGLVEAVNPAGEYFGRKRLEATLAGQRHASARIDAVRSALEAHGAGTPQQDDISLLLLGVPTVARVGEVAAPGTTAIVARSSQRADWSVTLAFSARELKRVEVVPVVADLARTLGLEGAAGARFFTVLSELFVNAIEHGLLGLDSTLKEGPDGFDRYAELREQRLQALESGHIDITVSHLALGERAEVVITVEDSGPGFDHPAQLGSLAVDMRDATALLSSGRGLPLLHTLCDRIEYEGDGNRVSARFSYH